MSSAEKACIFFTATVTSTPFPLRSNHQLQKSTTTFRVERYLEGALEYDVDLVRDRLGHTIFCICEHIEHAGVHSGDSGMVAPPTLLSKQCLQKIKHISQKLCELLGVVGPVNFQYAVKDEQVYCIEANPRGSRTLPFLSKAYNISLPQLATSAMLGGEIPNWSHGASEAPPFFAVKQSTFPFDRFLQDNIILGPKMRSTGETMGLDGDRERAVMKSYLGNYPHLDKVGSILFSLADKHKALLLPYLGALAKLDYQFMATPGTCRYIRQQGLDCQQVDKIGEASHRSIVAALGEKNLRVVFNTPQNTGTSKSDGEFIRNRAIQLGIPCFTRRENICAVIEAMLDNGGCRECCPSLLSARHPPTARGVGITLARTIVALDYGHPEDALEFLKKVGDSITWVKVGLELFCAGGREFVHQLSREYETKIFLDLKFHDIPNTVSRAIRALEGLPVQFLTLHLSGGREMLQRAVSSAREVLPDCKLLGVSYLTSLGRDDFRELYTYSERDIPARF